MSRLTLAFLKKEVKKYNYLMMESGSNYFFRAESRNGYTALDLHCFSRIGTKPCLRNITAGSPRECYNAMQNEYNFLKGSQSAFGGRITQKTVAAMLRTIVNFDSDYYELPSIHVDLLFTWKHIIKYRKPKNASLCHSVCYHFFNKLKNVKLG